MGVEVSYVPGIIFVGAMVRVCLLEQTASFFFACLPQVRRGGAIVGLDDVGSIIIDLIREGRRLLTNSYQVRNCCCRLLLASICCNVMRYDLGNGVCNIHRGGCKALHPVDMTCYYASG